MCRAVSSYLYTMLVKVFHKIVELQNAPGQGELSDGTFFFSEQHLWCRVGGESQNVLK